MHWAIIVSESRILHERKPVGGETTKKESNKIHTIKYCFSIKGFELLFSIVTEVNNSIDV
jgi:hypothetical protein